VLSETARQGSETTPVLPFFLNNAGLSALHRLAMMPSLIREKIRAI
jgi:hypothetical protein